MKVPVLLIVLAALLLTLPLLGPYTPGGHDLLYYFLYGQQTAANMRAGVWLPAWAPDLNYGFGGPALIFYPPLVNFIHGLFLFIGIPLWRGVGLLTFLAAVLSGWTALLWLRQSVPVPAALAGAVVYMVAPYRVIDIYERTALAEHWAFIFPPLILWAIGARRIAVVAFATAALLLTNLPLAVLFGLTIAAHVLVHRQWLVASCGALLGFAMAAMSLIPQALASRWLRVELWFGARQYRPSLNTLFHSAGDDPAFNARVSLLVVGTVFLALIAAFAARVRFWFVVAVVSFLSTTSIAGVLWDVVPLLSRLQFPWRATAVLTLALAALTAHIASARLRVALIVLAAVFSIPFYGESILRQELFVSPAPSARLFPDPRAIREVGGVTGNLMHQRLVDVWFIPRTVNPTFVDELQSPHTNVFQAPAVVAGNVRITRWGRLERTASVDAARPGPLMWHSLFFPEMEFIVDGRAIRAVPLEGTGLASVPLTAGRHTVTWRWRPFRELVVGRWISLAAFLVTLALSLRGTIRRVAR